MEEGLLVFRFEPFILAVECRTPAAAQMLVACAVSAGFRESGGPISVFSIQGLDDTNSVQSHDMCLVFSVKLHVTYHYDMCILLP